MLVYDVAYLTGHSVGEVLAMQTIEFAGWVAYMKHFASKHERPLLR